MNVANCFLRLIPRIQPTPAEIALAQQHVATIRARLNSTFKLNKIFVGGIFSRGTLIRGVSDVDLFAVFDMGAKDTVAPHWSELDDLMVYFKEQKTSRT
jgi:tRNA nucleotidyltransferase (CCA-adding enzyme)